MKNEIQEKQNSVIRVFLLIENRLLRDALTGIFLKQQDMQVVGSSAYSSVSQTAQNFMDCDVLLVDRATSSKLPFPFFNARSASPHHAELVFFGMDDDPETFLESVRRGVKGYLLFEASADEVLGAVRKASRKEAVAPAHLCFELFTFVSRSATEGSLYLNQRLCAKLGLTPRQQQLVALLVRGFTNKQIAASLGLSEFTVKNHVHRVMRQLNAQSRYQAVQTVRELHEEAAQLRPKLV